VTSHDTYSLQNAAIPQLWKKNNSVNHLVYTKPTKKSVSQYSLMYMQMACAYIYVTCVRSLLCRCDDEMPTMHDINQLQFAIRRAPTSRARSTHNDPSFFLRYWSINRKLSYIHVNTVYKHHSIHKIYNQNHYTKSFP
jgi:hypothetical protein